MSDAPAAEACPRCGAPLRADQDWCLECGAAARTRVARVPRWRVPVAIVGAVVALCGFALAFAFVRLADTNADVAAATATTAPPPAVAPPAATVPASTVTPPVTVAPATPTTPIAPAKKQTTTKSR